MDKSECKVGMPVIYNPRGQIYHCKIKEINGTTILIEFPEGSNFPIIHNNGGRYDKDLYYWTDVDGLTKDRPLEPPKRITLRELYGA